MKSQVTKPRLSKLGLLALAWSIGASSLLAFAPINTQVEAIEATHDDGSWAEFVTHPSLFDTQGASVLIPLAVPIGISAIALAMSYVSRSGLPFGIASVVLLIGCAIGAASIGLFFIPAAAMLAFAGGRTSGPDLVTRNPRKAGRRRAFAEEASGILGVVLGVGLMALLIANSDDPVGTPTRIAGAIAFGSLYLLPGVLAILGRGRPALYLAAGLLGTLLSFTSLAGVALPLLIPAVMSFIAYGRTSSSGSAARILFAVLAVVALAATSFFVLMLHEDPRCATTEHGSNCTSDVVTASEAGASIGLTAAALGSSWILAAPRRRED